MKHFLIALVFLAMLTNSRAQELEFHDIKSYKGLGYIQIIDNNNEFIYYIDLGKNMKSMEVMRYNIQTQKFEDEKKINLPENYAKSGVMKINIINGVFYFLSSFENEKTQKQYFFTESYDYSKNTFNKDLKKTAEIPALNKKVNSYLTTSQNGEFTSLLYINSVKERLLNSIVIIFDNKFNIINQYDNVFQDCDKISEYVSSEIDNNGTNYITIKSYKKDEDTYFYNSTKIPYKPFISVHAPYQKQLYKYQIVIASTDKPIKVIDILPLKGKFIKYASIYCIDTIAFIAGIYSNLKNYNGAGTFAAKINYNNPNKLQIENYFEFSDQFKKQYLSEKDLHIYSKVIAKKNYEIWDYHNPKNIGGVKFKNNFLLMIELHWDFTYTVQNGRSYSTVFVYNRDYVYLLNVDSNANINSTTKIPKKQNSVGRVTGASSYKVLDNKFFFIFNDVIEKSNKSSRMIVYEFNEEMSRKTYYIPTGERYTYNVITSNKWIGSNLLLGNVSNPSGLKGTDIIIKLKLNEMSHD
jgi:hypothetical protein